MTERWRKPEIMKSVTRTFTIMGEVQPKARPRSACIKGHARLYTPAKTLSFEDRVCGAYLAKYPNAEKFILGVEVTIIAYFPLNSSDYWPINSKHRGELRQSGIDKLSNATKMTKKPDSDNLKTICDGLNHAGLWRDDAQVWRYLVEKRYSETPRTEVTIVGELDEN